MEDFSTNKKKETVEEILHRVAKDFVPRDPDQVTVKNGHKMIRPWYNGFMQEKHICKNGKPCYQPSNYNSGWQGAIIQCSKCNQRYILEKEGWLLISGTGSWIARHAYLIIFLICTIIFGVIYVVFGGIGG